MKSINFKNLKKQYMEITLNDDNATVLHLTTPSKKEFDTLLNLYKTFTDKEDIDDETSLQLLNSLYDCVADILSRNIERTHITSGYLSTIFDFEDLIIFINGYSEFIQEITNSKN